MEEPSPPKAWNISTEQMIAAQKRVDAASDEACSLALDSIFDRALQHALLVRSMRKTEPD